MVLKEEIRQKISSGVWTEADAEGYIQELEACESLESYCEELCLISYGIFAYSCRGAVSRAVELCRRAGETLQESREKAGLSLVLMELYFTVGFQPKVVEYGLQYVFSGYAEREKLKTVYNCIMAVFSATGMYQEAEIYLEKMMDISRKTPNGDQVFETSDTLNELVYLDSLVYIKLGLNQPAAAQEAAEKLKELVQNRIPEAQREFFGIQMESTLLYLRMHQKQGDIAKDIYAYMTRLESGKWENTGVSFCIRYFIEFLEAYRSEGWEKALIRDGMFLSKSHMFVGNCSPVCRMMAETARTSGDSEIQSMRLELETMYIRELERERVSYDRMISLMLSEELSLARRREALERDILTGCLNRTAFSGAADRYVRDHKQGTLVFLDLDYLKFINDKYGHENGDRYLVRFVELIGTVLMEDECLYRYAGDEFIIMTGQSQENIESRLQQLLDNPPILFCVEKEMCRIRFSYGSASFEESGESLYHLIRVADSRMYCLKREHHQKRI